MSAEHVFHQYLLNAPGSRLPVYQKLKAAVLDVWVANNFPALIETTDPRYGDSARTFFRFFCGATGPDFVVCQYPPQASTLRCPDHLIPALPTPETPHVADAVCLV